MRNVLLQRIQYACCNCNFLPITLDCVERGQKEINENVFSLCGKKTEYEPKMKFIKCRPILVYLYI